MDLKTLNIKIESGLMQRVKAKAAIKGKLLPEHVSDCLSKTHPPEKRKKPSAVAYLDAVLKGGGK